MGDNCRMHIQTEFTTIPDKYAKHAPTDLKKDGMSFVSFPFSITGLPGSAAYLHWELVDDDAIPVCGFQWIHWAVANVPVDALMFDFNDPSALSVPEDFSRRQPALIPEAVQGKNSYVSRFVGCKDPSLYQRYVGPCPPDKDHDYMLSVWATSKPIDGIEEGFWLNELRNAMRMNRSLVDFDSVWLTGKA